MKRHIRNSLIAIICILAFIGCASQEGKGEVATWQDIKSLDQLVGKWEGSVNMQIPYDEENFMPESSIEISISIEYTEGSQEIIGEMKIDFDKLLTDWVALGLEAGTPEEEISKDILWVALTEEFAESDDFDIGGKYFLTGDLSGDADEALSDDDVKFQIMGNQIKVIFSETLSFGMGDEGFKEIILYKR